MFLSDSWGFLVELKAFPVEVPETVGLVPVDLSEEDDRGIETDRALRNKGYMRGPFSYRGHGDSYVEAISGNGNCRTDGTVVLRKILTTQQFRQSEEYWLRIKNMLSNGDALKWQLDFVEFVPVDIVNNDQYQEDWM